MLGIKSFSSQRPKYWSSSLPTHWIVNDTGKDDDTKTKWQAGIILSEEFRKYQLRRGFVSDRRSCKICGMEETPPGQGAPQLERLPTCRHVLESSPPHSVLWTPTVVRGCPENLEMTESCRHRSSFGAGWDLWCNVSEPCSFRLSQNLLKSPFFLDVSPMPWLSQAVLIFLVGPCQELLSSFTCTGDAPVVPSGSQGPGSLLLHGLFSRQQQKAPGRAEPHSATALLRLCNGFPAQSEYNLILQRGLTILIWCHPQLLLLYLLMLTPSPSSTLSSHSKLQVISSMNIHISLFLLD